MAAVALAIFVLALGAARAAGQALVSLQGSVTDPDGAAISLATVHLINPATNSDRSTTTDPRGYYGFSDVAPGSYRLLVEAQGFEEYEERELHIAGNAPTTDNVKLKLQQVQQSVTVRGQEGDQCLTAEKRVLPDVGPGLRAIRSGPSGNYYVLTSPGPSAAIYAPDGTRIGQVPAALPSASSTGSAILNGSDLQIDSDGRVYVADLGANAIKIYSADGKLVRAIRVPQPVSVEPLPGGEVAVASLTSKHLVDVYDEERGEIYRSFGDVSAPVAVECDSSTLVCSLVPPAKGAQPAAPTDRFWFYGDASGDVYVSLLNPPTPTIRKYDAYGYVAYESSAPSNPAIRAASQASNSNWGVNPDVRLPGVGAADLAGSTTPSNGSGGGGGGSVGIPFGLQITQKVAAPPVLKPKVEAIAVDPANQEIWASIAGNIVHFDEEGRTVGYYCISALDRAAVRPTTILVEPNRILIGSDPFGIFEYARPDKPLSSATPSH